MKPAFALTIGIQPRGGEFGNGDEDNLNREGHHKDGDGDLAGEVICAIIRSLVKGGPSAVRRCRAFCASLEAMCESSMDKDRYGHESAANEAVENLDALIKTEE